MSSKFETLGTIKIVGLAMLCCASISVSVGCSPEGGVKSGTGGKAGTGGATGSGGTIGTGGTTGTGGAVGSGGATGTGGVQGTGGTIGTGGDTGSGGAVGTGGDTGGAGAAGAGGGGGMSFLLRCGIQTATNSVYTATSATNAPLITDFTFAAGEGTSWFFGDTYNQVTGLSYHFPNLVVAAAGGAGGGAGGAGGRGGAGGAGGRGGAGGAAPIAIGLHEDVTASNWHITGGVGNNMATAFVLEFTCVIDASAYTGIQFTIGGNAGPANSLTLQAAIEADETGSYTTPGLGTCNTLAGPCRAPFTAINVTPTVTTVQLPWSRFTGGAPVATITQSSAQLVRFLWAWTVRAVPYNVDITIDDLSFMSAPVDAGSTD